jgi:hypothetical protein
MVVGAPHSQRASMRFPLHHASATLVHARLQAQRIVHVLTTHAHNQHVVGVPIPVADQGALQSCIAVPSGPRLLGPGGELGVGALTVHVASGARVAIHTTAVQPTPMQQPTTRLECVGRCAGSFEFKHGGDSGWARGGC